ncbi:hypothetical protein D3C85_879400 [compost metagenome]
MTTSLPETPSFASYRNCGDKMEHIAQMVVINEHVGVRLEWNPATDIDLLHYEVQMSIGDNSHYGIIGTTENTHFITKPIKLGTVCYFAVYAWDTNGNRTLTSNEVTIRVK